MGGNSFLDKVAIKSRLASGNLIRHFDYTGNITSVQISAGVVSGIGGNYTHSYRYDDLKRLVWASGDGSYYDPVDRKSKNFEATAHTHPEGSYPSGESRYEKGDVDFQFLKHRSKPGFVIAADNGTVGAYMGNQVFYPTDHLGRKN